MNAKKISELCKTGQTAKTRQNEFQLSRMLSKRKGERKSFNFFWLIFRLPANIFFDSFKIQNVSRNCKYLQS